MKNLVYFTIILINIFPLLSKQKLETVIQTGQDHMHSAAFTSDGKFVATGNLNNKNIIIWDVNSGKQLRTIRLGQEVYDMIMSKTENILFVADSDQKISYWDITTGKKTKEINAIYKFGSTISLSPNGKYIAAGGYDGDNYVSNIWDINLGERIQFIQTQTGVMSTTFIDDNKVATGLDNGTLIIWDVSSGKENKRFSGIGKEIWDIQISGDKKYLAASGYDGNINNPDDIIQIIDLQTYQVVNTIAPKIKQSAKCVFAPDNNHIIISNNNFNADKESNELEWWDFKSGTRKKIVKGIIDSFASSLIKISPDKKFILAFNKIRDAKTGEILKTLEKYSGHSQLKEIRAIAINPINPFEIAYTNETGFIRIWDLRKGKPKRSFNARTRGSTLEYTNDGKSLFTGVYGGAQKLNLTKLKRDKAYNLERNFRSPGNFDINKEQSLMIMPSRKGNDDEVRDIVLWDLELEKQIGVFKDASKGVYSPMVFTKDAKYVITGNVRIKKDPDSEFSSHYGLLQIYDTQTQQLVKEMDHSSGADCFALSHDGSQFALARQEGNSQVIIEIYRTNSWEKIKSFDSKGGYWDTFNHLIYSPNGQFIYGSVNNKIVKYEISSGNIVANYQQVDDILTMKLDQSGKLLFTGDKTGKVIVWQTENSNAELATLLFLDGIQTLKVNSIGTRGTRTAPNNSGAYLSRVIKDGPAFKAGMRNGDIITSFDGKNVAIATDYTNALLRGQKPGNNVALTYKRGEQSFNTEIVIEQNIFKDQPTLKNDWAIILSDYHYMASKNIHKSVHFVKGMKYYNFENFDLMYNRPEVVIERLGYANKDFLEMYQKAYKKRLSKMGFTNFQEIENLSFPEISIKRYNISKETSASSVQIPIKAYSFKSNLDRLNVYVNDVPIYGTKGLSLKDKNIKDYQNTIEVKLSTGHNKIQVSVHDAAGFESIKETVEINCTRTQKKPNLYIVSIGVSNYQDADFNLTYAAKDAKDLSAVFEKNSSFYGSIKTLKFLDEDATKGNILNAKKTLMQSSVDDEVIVFVAGHGLLDDKLDYYFATNNIDFYNPAEKGLKYDDLEGLLDGIPARKKLMLIDACHSGEVDKDAEPSTGNTIVASNQNTESGTVKFRGFKKDNSSSLGLQNSFELMKELFADLRRGTGAMVISSASGAEFAYESEQWNNGVFTFSVLEALRNPGTDTNYDSHIQISELRDYVTRRVTQLTGGRQHPTSRNENLDFDFSVW